jgi:hypothetical protein
MTERAPLAASEYVCACTDVHAPKRVSATRSE